MRLQYEINDEMHASSDIGFCVVETVDLMLMHQCFFARKLGQNITEKYNFLLPSNPVLRRGRMRERPAVTEWRSVSRLGFRFILPV